MNQTCCLSSLLPQDKKKPMVDFESPPSDLRWSSGWFWGAYCKLQEAHVIRADTYKSETYFPPKKGSKLETFFLCLDMANCGQQLRFSIQLLTWWIFFQPEWVQVEHAPLWVTLSQPIAQHAVRGLEDSFGWDLNPKSDFWPHVVIEKSHGALWKTEGEEMLIFLVLAQFQVWSLAVLLLCLPAVSGRRAIPHFLL